MYKLPFHLKLQKLFIIPKRLRFHSEKPVLFTGRNIVWRYSRGNKVRKLLAVLRDRVNWTTKNPWRGWVSPLSFLYCTYFSSTHFSAIFNVLNVKRGGDQTVSITQHFWSIWRDSWGAGVKGAWLAGVPRTIRNGSTFFYVVIMCIVYINYVIFFKTVFKILYEYWNKVKIIIIIIYKYLTWSQFWRNVFAFRPMTSVR